MKPEIPPRAVVARRLLMIGRNSAVKEKGGISPSWVLSSRWRMEKQGYRIHMSERRHAPGREINIVA
ncbi:hypothetical protein LJR030_001802 [Rhizobium sp. LjRoot30]|uniref:hypothetical protein n=1 Tax=Rhizobium sp. LjRoot30 TaxID=3342320 RepID=UPI003ECC730A